MNILKQGNHACKQETTIKSGGFQYTERRAASWLMSMVRRIVSRCSFVIIPFIRDFLEKAQMVNNPLVRPYLLGGWH